MTWLKKWLVKSLKDVAISIIQKEGDHLQHQIRAQVAGEADHCRLCDKLDRIIDSAQNRTLVLVASRGPAWAFLLPVRQQLRDVIRQHGDSLQNKLREGIKKNGPQAIDKIIDSAQAVLIKNIEALSI